VSAQRADSLPAASSVDLPALFIAFFRIGLASFGGLLTTMALIEREFVERQRLLTKDDITEALTYTRLLPGSGGPLLVSYLGFKIGGWSASAVATVALLLPGVLMMVALAVGYVGLSALPQTRHAIAGLLAAVVGIQVVALYRLSRTSVRDRVTAAIFVVALFASLVLDVSAPLVVVIAGIYGAIALAKP
jgi:chromate transporter